MDTTVAVVIALAWIACAVPTYGMTFAYFQRKYPWQAEFDYVRDRRFAMLTAVSGPIGLLHALFWAWTHGYYGFMWR